MYDAGWCCYYDDTTDFLDGVNGEGWDPNVEGQYTDQPELVHAGLGMNHDVLCSPPQGDVPEDLYYILDYAPHPAGLFCSIESYNGITVRNPNHLMMGNPCWSHGQVLHWIAAGGAFTCGNINGPTSAETLHADFVVANVYEHGHSWGEAVYTSLWKLGHFQTPVGDPLAAVHVHDPDVNDDHAVDDEDVKAVQLGEADVDGDGDVDFDDLTIVLASYGKVCPNAPNASPNPWPPVQSPPDPELWLGDANRDGFVTREDLDLVVGQYGEACNATVDTTGDEYVGQDDILDVLCHWGRVWGDVNGDCTVDNDDFNELLAQWGPCPPGCSADIASGCYPFATPEPDGVVDSCDLQILNIHWGNTLANCNDPPTEDDLKSIPPEFLSEPYDDCNGNLIPDDCEIARGWAVDANGNGVPDECPGG